MAKIKTAPVFTQEMSDSGEIPSLGMMFKCGNEFENDSRLVDFNGRKVKVIGISDLSDEKVITFSNETWGIGCGIFSKKWVQPLPAPIDLVDGAPYMFYLKATLTGFYRASRKSFCTRLIGGNKICGVTEATNIRLMTVESK